MTCIVGVEHETGVYIGGDSATIAGWTLELTGRPKVFRVGEFLIGAAGSPRVSGLIRHAFAPPPVPAKAKKLDRYMVTEFVPMLRAVLADAGAERKMHEVAAVPDSSTFLVGVRGRLFTIWSDYQVTHALHRYSAVGCATDVALGALHALRNMEVSPEDMVWAALGAAEGHNIGVREPFVVKFLPTPQAPAPAASKRAR